ncbi:MAG: hypothetical protein LJE84_08425 [Gammaproteobacteria bacterium]|jgi:hypothetical protein|nr:hypothetical protein [Gammaproteobacteria bacterium]
MIFQKQHRAGLALLLVLCAPASLAADTRQLVELPLMMREHMLTNMRDHLLALQEIQHALSQGDFDQAAQVAETRLGMSSLDTHGASHMAPHMPEGMRTTGTAMHRAASRFAVIVQESAVQGDTRSAIGALSLVMQQCVACHAAYRTH